MIVPISLRSVVSGGGHNESSMTFYCGAGLFARGRLASRLGYRIGYLRWRSSFLEYRTGLQRWSSHGWDTTNRGIFWGHSTMGYGVYHSNIRND